MLDGSGGAAICVAPVKGATEGVKVPDIPYDISIHAPVKGATIFAPILRSSAAFQSTLP